MQAEALGLGRDALCGVVLGEPFAIAQHGDIAHAGIGLVQDLEALAVEAVGDVDPGDGRIAPLQIVDEAATHRIDVA